MSDGDYSKELKYGEPHPAAQHAMVFLRMIPLTELLALKEAFASTTMSHNRNAEICGETLRRLLDNEPVSDRYLLGLAWTILTSRLRTLDIDLPAKQS